MALNRRVLGDIEEHPALFLSDAEIREAFITFTASPNVIAGRLSTAVHNNPRQGEETETP